MIANCVSVADAGILLGIPEKDVTALCASKSIEVRPVKGELCIPIKSIETYAAMEHILLDQNQIARAYSQRALIGTAQIVSVVPKIDVEPRKMETVMPAQADTKISAYVDSEVVAEASVSTEKSTSDKSPTTQAQISRIPVSIPSFWQQTAATPVIKTQPNLDMKKFGEPESHALFPQLQQKPEAQSTVPAIFHASLVPSTGARVDTVVPQIYRTHNLPVAKTSPLLPVLSWIAALVGAIMIISSTEMGKQFVETNQFASSILSAMTTVVHYQK
jgi:hypothetical protein